MLNEKGKNYTVHNNINLLSQKSASWWTTTSRENNVQTVQGQSMKHRMIIAKFWRENQKKENSGTQVKNI